MQVHSCCTVFSSCSPKTLIRAEVAAVERRRLVPVHEEDFTLGDDSTALRATVAIVLARRTDFDSVDADEQLGPTHGLARQCEDALDEWDAVREVTAIGEKGGKRLGWDGDDEGWDECYV
jgi:hypothetical protein